MQLRVNSRGEACVVHARGVTEDSKAQDSLQKGVASIQLKEQPNSTKVLVVIFLWFFSLYFIYFYDSSNFNILEAVTRNR